MSAKGRPEREHRSAQREGPPQRAKGRPEREHRSAQRDGAPASGFAATRAPARDEAGGGTARLRAFEGVGVEIEYAIVDRATLDVRPVADRLLAALAGHEEACDAERGLLGVSNELALHVVELKNRAPVAAPDALVEPLQALVREVDARLAAVGARLLPTGMHPWMEPARETVLWPHGGAPIYRAYDRIFDCRTHGYANVQAMHVNLPFADDREFERVHAAVRLVLPLVPAIAASSPIAGGRLAGPLDHRLDAYRGNALRFPSIAGRVIPETVRTRAEYAATVLQPMYDAIGTVDPAGVLQHEWLNARGAIARFDRHAIEIRLADTQECPCADLAVAAALVDLCRALAEGAAGSLAAQQSVETDALVATLDATIRDADRAPIADPRYRAALALPAHVRTAGDAWASWLAAREAGRWSDAWRTLATHGPLARRIVAATGNSPSRERLREVYAALADALAGGRLFVG